MAPFSFFFFCILSLIKSVVPKESHSALWGILDGFLVFLSMPRFEVSHPYIPYLCFSQRGKHHRDGPEITCTHPPPQKNTKIQIILSHYFIGNSSKIFTFLVKKTELLKVCRILCNFQTVWLFFSPSFLSFLFDTRNVNATFPKCAIVYKSQSATPPFFFFFYFW